MEKIGKGFLVHTLVLQLLFAANRILLTLLDLHHEMQILELVVLYACKISSNDAHFLSMYLKRK